MLTTQNPRILVTNDDGIHAPGLEVLEAIARGLSDDVWVVAPSDERSGAGHSVSLSTPIRMRQLDEKRYQVSGTPTDCVLMALSEIMTDAPPGVVLSGINAGANLAEDVTYSGTCAAAMEGTLVGIRSIALSQLRASDRSLNFSVAEQFGPDLIRQFVTLEEWPAGSFVNVNFPHCSLQQVAGIRTTIQGQRPPGAFSIDPREDSRGHPYYWVKIQYPESDHAPGTDLAAIADNAISVTPIRMNLTDHIWLDALKNPML